MKRTWQNWLAIVTLMTLTGTTMAQNGWNQPSEIGSYQSILSRAGCNTCDTTAGILGAGLAQPGIQMQGPAMQSGNMYGGAMMQGGMVTGGAMNHGGGNFGGAMMQGGAAAMGAAQAIQGQAGMVDGGSAMEATVLNGSMGIGSGAVGSTMVAGSVMSGMPASGAMGSQMYGSMMGGSVMAGPTYSSAPVYSSGPIYSEAPQCSTSNVFQQSVVAPVYANEGRRSRQRPNYTLGLTGLFFTRDYEDNRSLARNPSGGTLSTNDANDGTMDGYGVLLGARNCSGKGFEVGFWSLNPGRSVGALTGANVATDIQGFDNLTHTSSGRDLYDIYLNTEVQTIVRETDINNLEVNMLRNGGSFTTRRGRRASYELLGGFRWFQFDESLQYTASIDQGAYPGTPSDFFYNLETENRLLGAQMGARNEISLGSKLRLFTGVKGGIFNNNIQTRHNLTDINGEIAVVNAGPGAGRPLSYDDEKNDIAFLGELDFGMLYQLTSRSRIRFGYRVLGASGVALAADQMAYNYADPDELLRANSNGSLLLGGGYYGLEFCF